MEGIASTELYCSKCQEHKAISEFYRCRSGRRQGAQRYCKQCSRAAQRRSYQKHKNGHYKRYYGITQGEYDLLWVGQDGLCAICHKASDKPLQVDHDHVTEKVRGLLCGPCNRGLAQLRENPASMLAAISYLKRHNAHL